MKNFVLLFALIIFSSLVTAQPSASGSKNTNQDTIAAIQDVISSMQTRSLHLCKKSNSGEIEDEIQIQRPISDHDIIVQVTPLGNIATWNILNPDSPVSPGFLPIDHQGFYKLCTDTDKYQHMQDIAFTIGRLFAAGVDAIVLQEIPASETQNFSNFIRELNNAAYRYDVEFDIAGFLDSLYRTKKPNSNEYHNFSMGLLVKGYSKLSFISALPLYNERAVAYELLSKPSSEKLHLINIHGDYVNSFALSQNIKNDLVKYNNSIIAGDMNIPLSNMQSLGVMADLAGYCITPSMNRKDTDEKSNTLDCILSLMKSSKILVNGDLKNYAKDFE